MRGFWPAAAMVPLLGCGYVGDVQPPALYIPVAVTDLKAVQRGAKLYLTFTPPIKTTEQLPVAQPGEVDLRVGPAAQGNFDVNAWASTATRVSAEAEIGSFVGKEIFAAVRTRGVRDRWSDWSNVVAVSIAAPLAKPADFQVAADAAGVRLSWKHPTPSGSRFRVFRQAEKEERPTLIESKAATPWIDRTALYGVPYRYQVQAAIDAGGGEAESELSDAVAITAVDTFAPAVPKALTAIAGLSSIELAWERNTEADFRGYHIYRAAGEGSFERLGEPTEAPAYSDKSVQAGLSYRYAVTAVDQKGNESARSEPIAIAAPQ